MLFLCFFGNNFVLKMYSWINTFFCHSENNHLKNTDKMHKNRQNRKKDKYWSFTHLVPMVIHILLSNKYRDCQCYWTLRSKCILPCRFYVIKIRITTEIKFRPKNRDMLILYQTCLKIYYVCIFSEIFVAMFELIMCPQLRLYIKIFESLFNRCRKL